MQSFKYVSLLLAIFVSKLLSAQPEKVEMADIMHENGKIYVVIAVLCIIFTGITTYLVLIDRKVSKLEKEFSKK